MKRARRDGGAVLVELSLAVPVFLFLVLALLELGLAMRDWLTLADAVSDGVRAAAIHGPRTGTIEDDPPAGDGEETWLAGASADFVTVKRLRQGLGVIPVDWIDRIVIFHAQEPSAGPPVAQLSDDCRRGDGSAGSGPPDYRGACNVYQAPEAFAAYERKDLAYFNCALDVVSAECDWPGAARHDQVGAPDLVGVWIDLDRPFLTGVLGGTLRLSEAAVARLEPGTVAE